MSEHATLVDLPVRRSDAEIAADLRRKMTEALKPVIAVMEEARMSGLTIGWQTIGTDQLGRFHIPFLLVTKVL